MNEQITNTVMPEPTPASPMTVPEVALPNAGATRVLAIAQARAAAMRHGLCLLRGDGGAVYLNREGQSLTIEPASLIEPAWVDDVRRLLARTHEGAVA